MQRRRPEPLYHSFNCCNCRPIHCRECSSTCSAAEEETRANAMSLSSREAGLLVCRERKREREREQFIKEGNRAPAIKATPQHGGHAERPVACIEADVGSLSRVHGHAC